MEKVKIPITISSLKRTNMELSIASLSDMMPWIDEERNTDLLAVAFDAAVLNDFNSNDDGMFASQAMTCIDMFRHKPLNLEHEAKKIVGHITDSQIFDKNHEYVWSNSINDEDKFYVSLGGVVYGRIYPELADLLDKASDNKSPLFKKVSASWEIGFNKIYVAVGEGKMSECNLVKEKNEVERLKPFLKAYGGNGRDDQGRRVRRVLTGDLVPVGCAFTTNPAADVSGVMVSDEREQDVFIDEGKTKCAANKISQSGKTNVIEQKEKNMDLEKIMNELRAALVEKKVSEEAFASMSKVFTDAIESKDSEYQAKIKEKEEAFATIAKEREELKANIETINAKLESVSKELDGFKEAKAMEEALASFNARMDAIDQEYALDEEDRKIIAADLKGITTEEAFASYQGRLSVIWRDKSKVAIAAREAAINARIEKEIQEKIAKASVTPVEGDPKAVAAEALEQANASAQSEIPNGTEEQTNLSQKFAGAFTREGIEIS